MAGDIKVLHVDDEPTFTSLTADALERESDRFDVVTASSATDGLDELDAGDVDCLVSDYQMSEMDGLELLEAVRERDPTLPFVLFTGQGSEEIASEALTAGATEYLQKGGNDQFTLLANRIVNGVERRRAREQVTRLEGIRETLQAINQSLVRASSREEVEEGICEIIADSDTVRLVVVSTVDPLTNRVEPRAWAGDDGYLDGIESLEVSDADGRLPHSRAISELTVAITEDVQAEPAFEPVHAGAAERGIHALAVVPLKYGDTVYGLLDLYGGRVESPGDDALDLLEEIGDDIGHAMAAIETRRDLAASEARYRTLTNAISDAILTIDRSSTITFANPATEALFGYDRDELRGSKLTMLMPERHRESHRDGIARYLETGDRQLDWTAIELPGRHKDGSEIPLSISFGEFEQDGQQFFTGVIRDVSELAERNAELRRQNDFLDGFAGIVAHDLRNPLTVARGRVELARDEHDSEHLEIVTDTLAHMEHLIDDLLLLARHGQDPDDVAPVSLADVVETARQAVDEDAVSVEVDSSVTTILGHRGRVRVVLENLFRNAFEHGEPTVTIRVTMLDDGFAVEDDGPGIPADERDDVFEPGFTTKDDGTGFGLNIVWRIVEAHGWEIAVTEGPLGGARFEVTGVELDR